MLISHSKKYIFVHNYKVAGTSVHSALKASVSIGPSQLKKISGDYPKIYTCDFPSHGIDWRINKDFHLQKEFFYDKDGTLLMDFIGKFENLSADFNTICEKISVKASLPHLK